MSIPDDAVCPAVNLTGTTANDKMMYGSNNNNDTLNGGAGQDQLIGNSYGHTLNGESGDDTLTATGTHGWKSSVEGGAGDDLMRGSTDSHRHRKPELLRLVRKNKPAYRLAA